MLATDAGLPRTESEGFSSSSTLHKCFCNVTLSLAIYSVALNSFIFITCWIFFFCLGKCGASGVDCDTVVKQLIKVRVHW